MHGKNKKNPEEIKTPIESVSKTRVRLNIGGVVHDVSAIVLKRKLEHNKKYILKKVSLYSARNY